MISKRQSTNPDKVLVTFSIPGTIWAGRINLVGDFNNWDQESLPFLHNRRGDWVIELELDAGREYRFRYLLDGAEWRDEFQADKFVRNKYGTHDSVIVIDNLPDDAIEGR